MQRYGLIVADNGSDMYISGAFDEHWDNGILNPAFSALKADDFEVIELGWGGSVGCAGPGAPQTLSSNVSGQLVQLTWGAPAQRHANGVCDRSGERTRPREPRLDCALEYAVVIRDCARRELLRAGARTQCLRHQYAVQ